MLRVDAIETSYGASQVLFGMSLAVEAGEVVIHRLAPRFILRRGRLTGCIVNKGFSGAGLRLDTGTVSPQVDIDGKD